jgi:hypothetical protein
MDLDFGEVICNKCNGQGWFENQLKDVMNTNKLLRKAKFSWCSKCSRKGKLTWLEQVFGKNFAKIKYPVNN